MVRRFWFMSSVELGDCCLTQMVAGGVLIPVDQLFVRRWEGRSGGLVAQCQQRQTAKEPLSSAVNGMRSARTVLMSAEISVTRASHFCGIRIQSVRL